MLFRRLCEIGGAAMARTASLGIVLGVFATGCTAPGPRGEIPFGEWSGNGVVTFEWWKAPDEQAESVRPGSVHRRYPTKLSIRPGRLDGRQVIEMETTSDRGPLPGMGEQTHLKVALVRAKRVSDSTVLYRPVGLLINPAPDNALRYDDRAPPFGASCTTENGTTTFLLGYLDNFVDMLRFQGDRVEKSGVYFRPKEGLIHWSEQLARSK